MVSRQGSPRSKTNSADFFNIGTSAHELVVYVLSQTEHDRRADKNPYWHNNSADKLPYCQDHRVDCLSHFRVVSIQDMQNGSFQRMV